MLIYSLDRQNVCIKSKQINDRVKLNDKFADILTTLLKLCNRYKFPVKLWLGNRLFFGIADPQHLQIILNDQNSLDKNDIVKFLYPIFGKGLFAATGKFL